MANIIILPTIIADSTPPVATPMVKAAVVVTIAPIAPIKVPLASEATHRIEESLPHLNKLTISNDSRMKPIVAVAIDKTISIKVSITGTTPKKNAIPNAIPSIILKIAIKQSQFLQHFLYSQSIIKFTPLYK